MKINVDVIDLDVDEGSGIFTVDLDDENGHKMEGLLMEPDFDDGEVCDIKASDGGAVEDIVFSWNEDTEMWEGQSESEKDELISFSTEIIEVFCDIEYDRDGEPYSAEIKDDIQKEIRKTMNSEIRSELLYGYNIPDNAESSNKDIITIRAEAFLSKYPNVVAFNSLGKVANDNPAWKFVEFDTKKEAKEYVSDYSNPYNGYAELLDDIETVSNHLQCRNLPRILDEQRIQEKSKKSHKSHKKSKVNEVCR